MERVSQGYEILSVDEFEEGGMPRRLFRVPFNPAPTGPFQRFLWAAGGVLAGDENSLVQEEPGVKWRKRNQELNRRKRANGAGFPSQL